MVVPGPADILLLRQCPMSKASVFQAIDIHPWTVVIVIVQQVRRTHSAKHVGLWQFTCVC